MKYYTTTRHHIAENIPINRCDNFKSNPYPQNLSAPPHASVLTGRADRPCGGGGGKEHDNPARDHHLEEALAQSWI
jgi:hypothetical protein